MMKMPDTPQSNRLDVDIRVMQDKQFDFLKEFADRWDASIIKLEEIAEKFGTVGTGQTRPGGASPTASTGAVLLGPSGRPMARSHSGVNIADLLQESISDYVTSGPSPNASLPASEFAKNWGRAYHPAGDNPNEYVLGQFQLGQLPRGALGGMQYYSYLQANKAQAMFDSGNFVGAMARQKRAARAGDWAQKYITGRYYYDTALQTPILGASMQSALRGAHTVSPTMPMMSTMAQFGAGAGLSPSGIFGTQYGSPAWKAGVRAQWEGYKRGSWGSIAGIPNPFMQNPNYTREQAGETEKVIQQYGWNTKPMSFDDAKAINQGDFSSVNTRSALVANMGQHLLRSDLKNYTQKYQGIISQDEMMQMYDPVLRGQASLNDVRATLDLIGPAAKAANMELGAFKDQLNSASESFAKSSGSTTSQASRQIAAMSAATGMTPEQLSPILDNKRNRYMAMSTTGMNPWELATTDAGAKAVLKADQKFMEPIIGTSAEWQQAQKEADAGDDRHLKQLQKDFGWAYEALGADAFGGLSMEAYVNQRLLRDFSGRVDVGQSILNAEKAKTPEALKKAILAGGGTEQTFEGINKLGDFKGWDQEERSQKGAELLTKIAKDYNTEVGIKQGTQYEISIDPKYAKMFKLIEKAGSEGGSLGKGESNSKSWFDRQSSGAASFLKYGGGLDKAITGLIP